MCSLALGTSAPARAGERTLRSGDARTLAEAPSTSVDDGAMYCEGIGAEKLGLSGDLGGRRVSGGCSRSKDSSSYEPREPTLPTLTVRLERSASSVSSSTVPPYAIVRGLRLLGPKRCPFPSPSKEFLRIFVRAARRRIEPGGGTIKGESFSSPIGCFWSSSVNWSAAGTGPHSSATLAEVYLDL